MRIQDNNRYKVKQFILYVASKMEQAKRFGSVKLNKVLYRADHEAYRQFGQKITTYSYQKNKLGPTLYAYPHVVREMEEDGQLGWESRLAGRQTERRPIAKTQPDLRVFLAHELAIIDQEIERAWSSSGRGVSNEEHETAAWFATKTGERILTELTLVEDPGVIIPLSDEEQKLADAALQRFFARAGGA